jgi:hypothetical protein
MKKKLTKKEERELKKLVNLWVNAPIWKLALINLYKKGKAKLLVMDNIGKFYTANEVIVMQEAKEIIDKAEYHKECYELKLKGKENNEIHEVPEECPESWEKLIFYLKNEFQRQKEKDVWKL